MYYKLIKNPLMMFLDFFDKFYKRKLVLGS